MKIRWILCKLGFHKWYLGDRKYTKKIGIQHRYCIRCHIEQALNSKKRWRYFGTQAIPICDWCGWMGKVKTGEICPYCS